MNSEDFIKYLKSMSISVVMMLLLTYGMATNNPLLSPMYIILIIFVAQFGYQIIKNARSAKIVEVNIQDAMRAKRMEKLFDAPEKDIAKAKESSRNSGEMSMGLKMMIMILAPLLIFLASGYILHILIPEIEQWKSYMIGFLLSMPVSLILTIKTGVSPGTISIVPKSYIVTDKGIVFDYINQSFIMRFPLLKSNSHKENHFIEVETKTEAATIPNKLKLFSENIDQLEKILTRHILNKTSS